MSECWLSLETHSTVIYVPVLLSLCYCSFCISRFCLQQISSFWTHLTCQCEVSLHIDTVKILGSVHWSVLSATCHESPDQRWQLQGPPPPTFLSSLRFVGGCLTISAFTSLLSNGCERSDVIVDVIRRERRCRSLVLLSALARSKDLRGLHQSMGRSRQRRVMKSHPLLQWSSSLLRTAERGRWAYGRRCAESLCLPEVVTRPWCASGDVPDGLE